MKQFFAPNISGKGRLLRFLYGCVFMGIGWYVCYSGVKWLGIPLILGGGFTWFEAARGWCVMRACGIKTKL